LRGGTFWYAGHAGNVRGEHEHWEDDFTDFE
jgi:hypothetical protein